MRIAYLANVRFPSERAHAVQISHMCQAFVKNGVDVTLFANKRANGDEVNISDYFKSPISFSVKRLSHGYFSPTVRLSYYFSELFFSFNFIFSESHKEFDYIYSRHEWILWILSFFIKKEKLIWESHEAHYSFPARSILNKGIKTVVISEGILDLYEAKGHLESQFLVAHDAIDETFFETVETKAQARDRLGLPKEKEIVMYIGGFEIWKGIETFLKASEIRGDLLFVAIGGNEGQVIAYKKQYPKVVFLGARPYFELKDNQHAADVLVVPNSAKTLVSSEYTSPLKLFAHMASGVPLVVSDIPSLTRVTGKEMVTVFEADNAASLAECLLGAKDRLQQSAHLKNVALRYTWTNRAKLILKFTTF